MRAPRSWLPLAVVVAAAGIVGTFAACSDFTPPPPAGISGMSVNPRTAHVNVGNTLQLRVIGASGTVIWSSTAESVATVDFGKVTGVGSGSATIRAVSGISFATAQITVTRAAAIALSTSNVSFSGVASAALTDSQTVDITDAGEDSLTNLQVAGIAYGAGATGWLDARLTQPNAPSTLVLRPNTTALAPGSYTASVSINSTTLSAPPQVVTVTYTLTAQ